MRIAMLSWESLHSVAVGGVAPHASELAEALARKGHQVHVFTRRVFGQRAYDRIDGVHYHRCMYPAQRDFIDDVNSMCRSFVDRVFEVEDFLGRFDVVHAHDWLAANAMIWIKQGRGQSTVLTIHSTEYARCGNAFHNGSSVRMREQERAGTYWADRVIAVSEATRREIMWMYEVPESKTVVIHNGVKAERFNLTSDSGEDKRRYGIAPLDPTVLFCGRLVWQKGPDLLIEAIPRILPFYRDAKFVLVGDGEMRGQLEARARQLGIAHAVRFLGHRRDDELVRLFKLADVVCVPSRNEPFGIVVLEAWAADKPVVVTQTGGPNEYVWHEVTGLKIYPNPDSVAWGINTTFSDFERARRMGRNGRAALEERFGWETIAERTLDVYRRICPAAARTDTEKVVVAATAARPAFVPHPPVVRPHTSAASAQANSSPVRLRAQLSFRIADRRNGDFTRLEAFKANLRRQGFPPRERGDILRIDGDWEAVLMALLRCHHGAFVPHAPTVGKPDRKEAEAPVGSAEQEVCLSR
ncbi:MAG: glycosyltransferase family 4 protein [Sedimentisphaerales bacterium]|nr:glycosyltransferase family 4 protein [Sedimentisphaerales bacterium]